MKTPALHILKAIQDPQLLRPFLQDKGGKLETWFGWYQFLRALYGLPIQDRRSALVKQCTGRAISDLSPTGYDVALAICGRRSGKSRIAAIVGAYEAALAGHEEKMAPGERPVVAISSPTRYQSRIIRDYLRAIFEVPLLKQEIARETQFGFDLRNGTRLEISGGDYRTVRGYTLVAAVVDEAAFLGTDENAKVKSDTELITALLPGLATTNGKLIAITTPYAPRGWTFNTWKANFGVADGSELVWQAASRTMNPTIKQERVERELAKDPSRARAEWLGLFREDVESFVSRSLVESLVSKDRQSLMPQPGIRYSAFCDISGGRGDDAALCIAHKEGRNCIVDFLQRWKAPFNPHEVVRDMAAELARFGLSRCTGDNYSAEFLVSAFAAHGIRYTKSDKPKSRLYDELLPRLCSREIELPDNELLVNQLCSLERRTRSGARDQIDHGPGQKDDVANALAGAVDVTCARILIGRTF